MVRKEIGIFILLTAILSLNLTSAFEYKSQAQNKCIEGSLSCEAGHSELWECQPDGNFYKTECPMGCEYIGESKEFAKCKTYTDDEGFQNKKSGDINKSLITTYSTTIIILLAVIIYLVKKKNKK